MEFLDNAGNNTNGEVDQEDLAPEFGHPLVDLFTRPDIFCLQDGDKDRETEGYRDKKEVKDCGDGKLPPGKDYRIHRHLSLHLSKSNRNESVIISSSLHDFANFLLE